MDEEKNAAFNDVPREKRKRRFTHTSSDTSEDDRTSLKSMTKSKRRCYAMDISDEDKESIYSLQGYETAYARDTSDTSSNASVTSTVVIEYELDSLSESEEISSDSLSLSSNHQNTQKITVIGVHDKTLEADDSDSCFSWDDGIKFADYHSCICCYKPNDNPKLPFCRDCYQKKKSKYDPKNQRQRPRNQLGTSRTTSLETNQHWVERQIESSDNSEKEVIENNNIYPAQSAPESGQKAQETSDDLCVICHLKPKNGAFLHRRYIIHICCCYDCALKIYNKGTGRCLVCNERLKGVAKDFCH